MSGRKMIKVRDFFPRQISRWNLWRKSLDKGIFSFLKHGTRYVSGNFLSAGIVFLAMPIYTRLLTPSDYGCLALFNTASSILGVIIGLQMYGAIGRYYFENENDYSEYLGTNLILIAVLITVQLFFLWVFRSYIMSLVGLKEHLFYLLMITSTLPLFISIYLGLLVAQRESYKYTLLNFVRASLIVTLSIVLMKNMSSERYLGAIYAQTIIVGFLGVYCLFMLLRHAKFKLKATHVTYSLRYNLPFIPGALSTMIISYYDRILISNLSNTTNAGLYSIAFNIAVLLSLVYNGLFGIWVPSFIEAMRDQQYEGIKKLLSIFTAIVLFVGMTLAIFSKEIIFIMASKDYSGAEKIIPIIVLGFILKYVADIYSNFCSYRKEKIFINSLNITVVCGLGLAMNYILIPKFGYTIAAFTMAISAFMLTLLII